jgi:hypothetical protein
VPPKRMFQTPSSNCEAIVRLWPNMSRSNVRSSRVQVPGSDPTGARRCVQCVDNTQRFCRALLEKTARLSGEEKPSRLVEWGSTQSSTRYIPLSRGPHNPNCAQDRRGRLDSETT